MVENFRRGYFDRGIDYWCNTIKTTIHKWSTRVHGGCSFKDTMEEKWAVVYMTWGKNLISRPNLQDGRPGGPRAWWLVTQWRKRGLILHLHFQPCKCYTVKKIRFVSLLRSTSLIKYLLIIFVHTTRPDWFFRMQNVASGSLLPANGRIIYCTHQTFYEAGFSYLGMYTVFFLEKLFDRKSVCFRFFCVQKGKKEQFGFCW